MQVPLQVGGPLGRTGLVIDDLVHPVGVAVHSIDPAAEPQSIDAQAERLLQEKGLAQVTRIEGPAQVAPTEVL